MTDHKKQPGLFSFLFLPGFGQSFSNLRHTGGFLTQTIASLFVQAGLLTRYHPATHTRYGLSALLSDAAKNVEFKWRGIPNIVLLLSVVVTFVLAILMLVTLALQLGIGVAEAAGLDPFAVLDGDEAKDWLRQIFGPCGGVASCSEAGDFVPSYVTKALAGMVALWSGAMLVLGSIILIIHFIGLVGDMARHGAAAARDYNDVWGPIRMFIGFAALFPLAGFGGLNGGQLVVLKTAELGSNLATNVWGRFYENVKFAPVTAISSPKIPLGVRTVVGQMFITQACREAVDAFERKSQGHNYKNSSPEYVIEEINGTTYGYETEEFWDDYNCGEIKFKEIDEGDMPGAKDIQQAYIAAFESIKPALRKTAREVVYPYLIGTSEYNAKLEPPDIATSVAKITKDYNKFLEKVADKVAVAANKKAKESLLSAGPSSWIHAGEFYIREASVAGSLMSSAQHLPSIDKPDTGDDVFDNGGLREAVAGSVKAWNKGMVSSGWLGTVGGDVGFLDKINGGILPAFASFFSSFAEDVQNINSSQPVFSLMVLGHSMLNGVINMYDWIFAGALTAGIIATLAKIPVGALVNIFLGLANPLALALLLAGCMLVFLLPLLPVITFGFGIISWLTSVAEALIAIPLFALAHLRMDGKGFFGPSAKAGYLFLLQIVLRPVLMVFGLLVAIAVLHVAIEYLIAVMEYPLQASRASAIARLAVAFIFAMTAYGFAKTAFRAIDILPSQVLRWIGGQQVSGMDETRESTQTIQQGMGAARGGVGGAMGSITGSMGAGVKAKS